ncbi:MAG: DUF3575 domain-containing protein [Kaistella sp.]|nr:DUF3575 domain-containing protein [Kaistella sp.]
MKTLLLSCFLILVSAHVSAQETDVPTRQNDIIFDPITTIAGMGSLSYERLLNQDSGVGIHGFFYLGNEDDYDNYRFMQISPFYRMYFGKKYASGFFVEGFLPITTIKDSYYYYEPVNPNNYSETVDRETTVGLGVGAGGKWVTKRNIIFEASAGIARRFAANNDIFSSITAKWMLGIGYRF